MVEIPSQMSFEQMLSHLFPGIFLSVTLFMFIDLISSEDLSAIVLKDINALVAFAGLLFISGTILGIIIDAFHHNFLEEYFFDIIAEVEDDPIRCQTIIDYFVDQHCNAQLFCGNQIKDISEVERGLIDVLEKKLGALEWKENAKFEIDDNKMNVIDKNDEKNKISILLKDKEVTLTYKEKTLHFDIKELCGKIEKCKFYNLKDDPSTAMIYYFFSINSVDKYISIYEHLRRSIFHYYEFYANTFVCMIPFTIVAPLYIHNTLGVTKPWSLFIAITLASLTYFCLYSSCRSRQRYFKALYFAYCNCRWHK